LGEQAAAFRVRGPFGKQWIEQPAVNILSIETGFTASDQGTMVVAMGEDFGVFATPRTVEMAGADTSAVYMEARLIGVDVGRDFPDGLSLIPVDLLTLDGQTASLDSQRDHYLLTGLSGGDPVTEVIETGVEFGYTPVVSADGSVVTSQLHAEYSTLGEHVAETRVRGPYGKQWIRQPVVKALRVNTFSEAPDGGTVMVASGMAETESNGATDVTTEFLVLATPEAIDLGAGPPGVHMAGRLLGKAPGDGAQYDTEQVSFDLTTPDGQWASWEDLRRQFALTGPRAGMPVVTVIQTGVEFECIPVVSADEAHVTSDLHLTHRAIEKPAETFRVRSPRGKRWLDQPVVHSLQVDTVAAVPDGETVAVAGLGEELLFITPSVIDAGGGALQVLMDVEVFLLDPWG
jgi:hypothetical protein